jgi:hypothetical protein
LLAFHADQSNFRGVNFSVQSLLLLVQSYCVISIKFTKKKKARY